MTFQKRIQNALIPLYLLFALNLNAASWIKPYGRNYKLKEKLEEQIRILPQGKHYSLASDIHLWKYIPEPSSSYYHGAGYWLDTYFEYRPTKTLWLNAHFILLNGTMSEGYVSAQRTRHLFGATWEPWGPRYFQVIFWDLEKLNLGAGLFVEDRESPGVQASLWLRNFRLRLNLLGTSIISVTGDLRTFDITHEDKYYQPGIMIYQYADVQTSIDRWTTYYLNSFFINSTERTPFKFNFESAYGKNRQWSLLAKLGLQNIHPQCKFCFELYGQYRKYKNRVLEGISGATHYEWVPYSLSERNYTNAHNILSYTSAVKVHSAHLNFKALIGDRWKLAGQNEYGTFNYKSTKNEEFFWYKYSFGWCPMKNMRESCVDAYASNKILRAISPEISAPVIYRNKFIVGIEGRLFI